MSILNWFKRIPWFQLKSLDHDLIKGRVGKDQSLTLHVDQGGIPITIKLTGLEAQQLQQWLTRVYGGTTSGTIPGDTVARVLPLRGKRP